METLPNKQFSLGQATQAVLQLKRNISADMIKLGKILLQVKENIPPGEWMDWLKYQVHIPYVTAWRYIKISKEIDQRTIEKVGSSSKIFEILEAPAGEFRDNLLDMASGLKVKDIRQIVKDYPKSDIGATDTVEGKILESESEEESIPAEVDAALQANAALLDCLLQINIAAVTQNMTEFLESQLKHTPDKVGTFLKSIENARASN